MKAQAIGAAEQAQSVASANEALTLRQNGSVSRETGGLGTVAGEIAGLELSRLEMVWGVGKNSKLFHPGDLIIDGQELIAEKHNRLTVIMVSATTYWKDWLTQAENDAGVHPNRYPTKDAAAKAGKTVDWSVDGSVKPNVAPAIEIRMLVRKPDSIESDRFFVRVGDHMYAPVRFSAEKTVYKGIAQVVLRRMAYDAGMRNVPIEQGHIHTAFYELFTEIETRKTRTLPCPYLVPKVDQNTKKQVILTEAELAAVQGLFKAVTGASAPTEPEADEPTPF